MRLSPKTMFEAAFPPAFLAVLVIVAAVTGFAAWVGGSGAGATIGSEAAAVAVGSLAIHAEKIPSWLSLCLVTGVVEEFLFRGVLFSLCEKGFSLRGVSNATMLAAIASSAMFGLFHISGLHAVVPPLSEIQWVQLVAKPIQAFFFGLLMTACFARTKSLMAPIVVHVLYDLVYFAPLMLLAGVVPATHVTGNELDCVALCASLLVFALLVRAVARDKRGVVPYTLPDNEPDEER